MRRAKVPVGPRDVRVGPYTVSNRRPLFYIAGTCSFESEELLAQVGKALKALFKKHKADWVLKCSFDKANRSSGGSYRGQGMAKALEAFARVKGDLGVPMLTDIHDAAQADTVAMVCDVLQIPAFLCRQTDLLRAAGRTGRVVNIKKGQFLSPWDIGNAVAKVESTGNRSILLTERGSSFGYANLVVDMRSLEIMKETGYPVILDATHSCQLPGALGHATGGQREYVPVLGRAAAAVGVAGMFLETHPDPDKAKSDGPNSIKLAELPALVRDLAAIDAIVKRRRP
ncbi:MAG: 3-deoxy-8-phosphooctulonate synthase [Elusimicrobia bacterium]|nr:3-deoxy-8-phosphooctulonate synthase [Elusimicrobiota bacterium]